MKALAWVAACVLVTAGGTILGYLHGQRQAKVWEKPPRPNDLMTCVHKHLEGFDVEIAKAGGARWGELTLILRFDGQELYRRQVHAGTVFVRDADYVLYFTDFSPIASGCRAGGFGPGPGRRLSGPSSPGTGVSWSAGTGEEGGLAVRRVSR